MPGVGLKFLKPERKTQKRGKSDKSYQKNGLDDSTA
jgi:hypothetical protein